MEANHKTNGAQSRKQAFCRIAIKNYANSSGIPYAFRSDNVSPRLVYSGEGMVSFRMNGVAYPISEIDGVVVPFRIEDRKMVMDSDARVFRDRTDFGKYVPGTEREKEEFKKLRKQVLKLWKDCELQLEVGEVTSNDMLYFDNGFLESEGYPILKLPKPQDLCVRQMSYLDRGIKTPPTRSRRGGRPPRSII